MEAWVKVTCVAFWMCMVGTFCAVAAGTLLGTFLCEAAAFGCLGVIVKLYERGRRIAAATTSDDNSSA